MAGLCRLLPRVHSLATGGHGGHPATAGPDPTPANPATATTIASGAACVHLLAAGGRGGHATVGPGPDPDLAHNAATATSAEAAVQALSDPRCFPVRLVAAALAALYGRWVLGAAVLFWREPLRALIQRHSRAGRGETNI